MIFIILLIVLLLLYFLYNGSRISKINSKIPGPIGLPFFGHYLFMFGQTHIKFQKWFKKYGPIYRIRIGQTETVVITGYPTLRKCFVENSNVFANRFQPISRFLLSDCSEIIFENGEKHNILKKVIMSEMTSIRIKKMEDSIIKEIEKLYKILDIYAENSEPFHLNSYIHMFSLNIVLLFTFGLEYPYQKVSQSEGIVKTITDFVSVAGVPLIFDFIPSFQKVNKNHQYFAKYRILKDEIEKLIKKFKESIENNQTYEYDPIIGKLINEYNKGTINWDNVINTSIDIIAAGSDTTSNTMLMCFAVLVNNQDIQKKLYDNIKSNTQNESVILHSKYNLSIPYLTMVIKETFRYFPNVPLGVSHVTSSDITIDGHTIAKGTQIIQNIYSSHRSEEFYSNPDSFIPERFNENSNLNYGSKNGLTQFGIGVRDCVGKALAGSQIFALLSSLFNRYEFLNPNPNEPINEVGDFGMSLQTKDFKVLIKRR